MPNETGDMKITGNFRRLIDFVIPDALYAPTNSNVAIVNLEAGLAAAIAAVAEIGVKLAPNKFAINARQDAYIAAVALIRGSRNILKSSGASAQTLADADTFTRKIFGVRKSKKVEDDPNTPANEAEQNHSASQRSYDAVLGNIRSYIQIVSNEPLYDPTEARFKIAALTALADDLEAKNNAVSTTFVPVNSARILRDELLYTGATCLCNLAQMVKAYVRAVHGATSPFYKTVNALSFKRSRR